MVKSVFVFVVLTACLQCVAIATSDLDSLNRMNFQIGISSLGVRLSNSTSSQCAKELEIFLNSVKENELWAVKLIDSFGLIPQSFHWGNYFWFSSGDLCEDLNEPIRLSLSARYNHTNSFNTSSPYAVRFWMIYLNFTTPVHVDFQVEQGHHIHIGLCLPRSCSQDDVVYYTQTYFTNKSFELQQRFDIAMDVADAKSPEFKWIFFLKPGVLISFAYLALSVILMIIADQIHKNHLQTNNDNLSRLEQFFLCFHLKDNFEKTIGNGDSKGFFPIVAGLRTILCVWITMAHIVYFCALGVKNLPEVFAKLEYFIVQPIVTSVFYEDGFFVLSAFLLVYNFLSNLEQMKAIKANSLKENLLFFLRQVFNRYMRLIPVVLATLIAVNVLYEYLEMTSVFHLGECSALYCKKNWKYTILLMNNVLDFKSMCCTWMWYLACEMQLFSIFTGLLIIFGKNNSIGKSLFQALLVAGVVICFFCHYYYDSTFQIDTIFGSGVELYTKPWVRINSYTGGALIGWLFHKRKEYPIHINAFGKSAFWTFAFLIYLGTSFMSYWRTPPLWLMASIMSFGKLIFALCLGGVIVLCEWGHGGLFNAILSSRPFLIFNNLCYTIYMITPVLIVALYALQPVALNLSIINTAMDAVAIMVLSVVVSFGVVLWIELPAEKFRSKFLTMKTRKEKPPSKSNKVE